ncbi:MAG TPA: DUF4082 domain-containing protein [Terracidiphilus sp.]|nr:DUF4082 domain-containing protein [Terracidiphilus sp.]
MATVTFSGEISGWQQANLSAPVPITANTAYVVSCHSDGGFSADENYFSSAVDNPPLHAPANGTSGGNGVFAFGPDPIFPTMTTSRVLGGMF